MTNNQILLSIEIAVLKSKHHSLIVLKGSQIDIDTQIKKVVGWTFAHNIRGV